MHRMVRKVQFACGYAYFTCIMCTKAILLVVVFFLILFPFLFFWTLSCFVACLYHKQVFQVFTPEVLVLNSCNGILHQSYLTVHNTNKRIELLQLRLHHL